MIREEWSLETPELIVCERCGCRYFAGCFDCYTSELKCPRCNAVEKTIFLYMNDFPYGMLVNPNSNMAKGVIVNKYDEEGRLIYEMWGTPSPRALKRVS